PLALGEVPAKPRFYFVMQPRHEGTESAYDRLRLGRQASAATPDTAGVSEHELTPQPRLHLTDLAPRDPEVDALALRGGADAARRGHCLQKRYPPFGERHLAVDLNPNVAADLHA